MGCELVEPGIYLARSEKIANALTPSFFLRQSCSCVALV